MTHNTKYIFKYLSIHKDMSVLSQLIFFWQNLECIMIPDMAYIFFWHCGCMERYIYFGNKTFTFTFLLIYSINRGPYQDLIGLWPPGSTKRIINLFTCTVCHFCLTVSCDELSQEKKLNTVDRMLSIIYTCYPTYDLYHRPYNIRTFPFVWLECRKAASRIDLMESLFLWR